MSISPAVNIFSQMSALAQEHNAINLSQGFPDFPIDPKLIRYYTEAALQGYNQYAPMAGLPGLQEAIAADIERRLGLIVRAHEEVTITPGATYAIYTAFATILEPGDEVIVLEPAYDSYIPNILAHKAIPVPIALVGDDFQVDWQAIKEAIGPKTKAIIVNTPHNPSGTIWGLADWQQLAAILQGTDIYVLSDEVYEQLVYDGQQHYSVLHIPELRTRAFALYSFGKVLHNTGWKIGYAVAGPDLSRKFRAIHQYLCFSVHTPAQYAIMRYLQDEERPAAHLVLAAKRDYFYQLMQQSAFRLLKPAAGSYFQLLSYEGLSNLKDKDFAIYLVKEYGVASIPLSPFYSTFQGGKLLRFCFAKKEATLAAAAERLSSISL